MVPILIIPLLATFAAYIVIYYLIGQPIAIGMNSLYDFINHITETYASAPIIYGAILGAMMGFDLGGPVNKTALLVSSDLDRHDESIRSGGGQRHSPGGHRRGDLGGSARRGDCNLALQKAFSPGGTDPRLFGLRHGNGRCHGRSDSVCRRPSVTDHRKHPFFGLAGALVAAVGIHFYGGIGSPLGAFIGYTTGPAFSWLWWILSSCSAPLSTHCFTD